MTAFASAADLRILDPGVPTERADLVLEMVSDGIRAGVGWQVDEHQATKVVRPRSGEPVAKVFLKALNVRNVTVKVGTRTLSPSDYTVDPDQGTVTLHWRTSGTITINYTGGWPVGEIPGIFRTVALEWGMQYAANPSNLQSYMLGRASETFRGDSSSQLVIEDDRLVGYSLGPGFA